MKKGAEGWTGSWPSPIELPQDQRRDTACPFTFRNETRHRIKRWPDIIGIAAPKCGTGTMAFFDCHKKIVFREAEGMIWAKEWVILKIQRKQSGLIFDQRSAIFSDWSVDLLTH